MDPPERLSAGSRLRRWAGTFGRSPAFGRLWAARVASLLGDAAASVTLIIYLTETDGRGLAVGLLLLAGAAPQALSPLAGTLADRVDQRRLMIASETGQAVLMAVIALLLPSLALLAALWFVRGMMVVLFHPAGRSSIPELVDDADLPAANGLLGAGGQGSRTVGPALAGLLFPIVGVRGVLVAVAGLSLVSIWLLLALPRLRPARDRSTGSTFLGEAREGLGALRTIPVAGIVAVVLFAAVLFASLDDVALSFLGSEEFDASEMQLGLLFSAAAFGLVVGGLFVARIGRRTEPARLLLGGLLATAAGLLAAAASPLLALVLLAQVVNGFGNGLENASIDTLIHRNVPRRLLGRVFGTVYGGAFVASAIAYAVGGLLLDATSPRAVFAIAGGGVLVVGSGAWVALKRHVGRQR